MPFTPGTDLAEALSRGEKVEVNFRGVDKAGDRAIVQRTGKADYAQYDDLRHPKSLGWWKCAHMSFTRLDPHG